MIDKTIPIMQAGRVQRRLTLEKALIIQENDHVKSILVINITPKTEKKMENGPTNKTDKILLIIPSVFFITPPPFCEYYITFFVAKQVST